MATRREELELQKARAERELANTAAAEKMREDYPWLGPYSCNPDIFGIDIRLMSLDAEDAREIVALRHVQRVRRGLSIAGPDPKVVREPITQSARTMPDAIPTRPEAVARVLDPVGAEGSLPPVVVEGPDDTKRGS